MWVGGGGGQLVHCVKVSAFVYTVSTGVSVTTDRSWPSFRVYAEGGAVFGGVPLLVSV